MFWSTIRAPAAMPRRWAGTAPIIAAVFGLRNDADADADDRERRGAERERAVDLEQRHQREAGGGDDACPRGEPARAVAVGVAARERRGDEHAERERRQLEPGGDRRVALRALEVEDEDEQQPKAHEAVEEPSRRSRR